MSGTPGAAAAPAGAPSPATTAAAPPKVLSGLSCPSCGGSLEAQEGWTNLVCRYCNASLLAAGGRGVARYMVLDRVDRARAESALRGWLGSGIRKAPGLAREARIEEAFLAWFPFVRARLDVVGWILGIEKVTRNKKTVRVPREIEVERSYDVTRPAGDMSEFGVERVLLAGDQLLPFDEERLRSRGMVFRPQIEPEEVARAIAGQSMDSARAGARLHQISYEWLRPVRRRTALVYYPLWVLRYSFRGRTYQVLVDADDGTIAYGQAPANALVRAVTLVAAVAGAMFAATTILQWIGTGSHDDDSGGLILGVLFGAGVAVWWGYRQFRYGSILEEGTGVIAGISGAGAILARLGAIRR